MRKLYLPAIAAACLFAVPALAATDTTAASDKTSSDTAQIQKDLHQDLTKAGYTDIRIEPGSFFVRAKNKQGNETEMMISPHSMTEVTAISDAGAATKKTDAVPPPEATKK